jgi:hypothetical protein
MTSDILFQQQLNTYLSLGYLPRLDREAFPLSWVKHIDGPKPDNGTLNSRTVSQYATRAAQELSDAICCNATTDSIVPISGGLDSRLVLAVLSRQVKCHAVTIGSPNTLDFELPKMVAKHAGVSHEFIDLGRINYQTSDIVRCAQKMSDATAILPTYFNLLIAEKYYDTSIQTGLLGDFIGGAYAIDSHANWDDAKSAFMRTTMHSSKDVENADIANMERELSALTFKEELVLRLRHTCTYRPHLFSGYENVLRPLLHRNLIRFFFSLPRSLRGSSFYHRALYQISPKLMRLPSTSSLRGIRRIMPNCTAVRVRGAQLLHGNAPALQKLLNPLVLPWTNTNYFNVNEVIRDNPSFSNFARENICDLQARNIFDETTPDQILQGTLNGDYDHIGGFGAHPLSPLLNLEICLKANLL